MNDWTLSVQNRKCVALAYVDFSCAFDCVSHEKLFTRLTYDIQGELLCWLRNFFVRHTHKTKSRPILTCLGAVVAASRIFGSSAVFIFLAVLLPFNILNLYQSSWLYPAASS